MLLRKVHSNVLLMSVGSSMGLRKIRVCVLFVYWVYSEFERSSNVVVREQFVIEAHEVLEALLYMVLFQTSDLFKVS